MQFVKSLSFQDRDLFLTHEIIQLGYSLEQVETVKKTKATTVFLDLIQKSRKEIYEFVNAIQNLPKDR